MFVSPLPVGQPAMVPLDALMPGLERASRAVRALALAPGTRLAFPGHDADAARLYRVRAGCLALTRQLDAERRQILDILGPGRFCDGALLARLHGAAVALAPTQLEPVDEASGARASLAAQSQDVLLIRALGHVTRLGRQSAGERVAAVLLDLAAQFAEAWDEEAESLSFPLHLSRGDLADWLGLTLETVSRCMSRLREDGLIAFGKEGRLILQDLATLRRIAVGECKVEALYAAKGRTARAGRPARRGATTNSAACAT
ncbi:Crp/Fnr family transcriptional regulator [Ancylobacter vacuolatus]|uniref:CRP/FNR family transcriptional regulator n=1 Tax=Ancylobacter vacuolatus TaxID=223389 RepID=A0ABU0DDS7_9HYPH|nr:Crp/Fnr family transcriptional regulator [Ancylobacter vacuolatus]MDQ0346583.1 CRP/FNR family transcriptional regulator [Ancylobacter vacuolatus]